MQHRVLLTGATGYVGGRLLAVLEQRGVAVRCLARRPEFLRSRVGATTEVVAGDVRNRDSLAGVFTDMDTAFYLVHSMGSAGSFEEEDRQAAVHFAEAAAAAGVRRIIYLGGLGDPSQELSAHLRSRHLVGDLLRSTGVPVIEFRASIVLGAGSLSFEMIRALTERLPIMIAPRWVSVPAQPIAIADVLQYLVAALDHPAHGNRVYEIGGADRVSYGELMREYARQRGLKRLLVPVPVLTPRLSSLWLGLVTPVYARVGRKLIESIRHPTVVRDPAALEDFSIRPIGYREAIAAALAAQDDMAAGSRWSDSVSAGGPVRCSSDGRLPRRFVDRRVAEAPVAPAAAFAPIQRIGGANGWYYGGWLWWLRGFLDLLVGGVGMRRGRRARDVVRVGDTVDCWRVEAFEPDRQLLLRAEMALPGQAWLEFQVEPTAAGSRICQTATFDAVGFAGRAYWYAVSPLHQFVFGGMLRGIVQAAQANPRGPAPARSWSGELAALLVFLTACLAAGALGAAWTARSVGDWYQTLAKPSWTPPDGVFGPVWTTLYVLMALAAWLYWRRTGLVAGRIGLGLFAVQLALNAAWSGLFFALRRPGLAFAEILVLWCALAGTLAVFRRASALAAGLLGPYLAWVSYAVALNGAIWAMNR